MLSSIPGRTAGELLIALDILFLCMAWIFFLLRIWSRRLRGQRIQLNDWLLLAALICQVGQSTVSILLVLYGGWAFPKGHQTKAQLYYSGRATIPGSILWEAPLFFIKLSILHFYTTLFKVSELFRKACYSMMYLCLLNITVFIVVVLIGCIPMEKMWDHNIRGACLDTGLRVISTAIVNVIIDVMIVLLPMPIVWRLKLSVWKRIQITLLLCAALGVCVVSGLRIYWLTHPSVYPQIGYVLCTLLEPDLSAILACLPMIAPIAAKIAANLGLNCLRLPHKDESMSTTLYGTNQPNTLLSEGKCEEEPQHNPYQLPEMNLIENDSRSDLESAINRAGEFYTQAGRELSKGAENRYNTDGQ